MTIPAAPFYNKKDFNKYNVYHQAKALAQKKMGKHERQSSSLFRIEMQVQSQTNKNSPKNSPKNPVFFSIYSNAKTKLYDLPLTCKSQHLPEPGSIIAGFSAPKFLKGNKYCQHTNEDRFGFFNLSKDFYKANLHPYEICNILHFVSLGLSQKVHHALKSKNEDEKGGSTLASFIQYHNSVICMNVGDSPIGLFKLQSSTGKVTFVQNLTSGHCLEDNDEESRVINEGGQINEEKTRVGSLNMTRSIGDGKPGNGISEKPDFTVYDFGEQSTFASKKGKDEIYFALLCSDGMFDYWESPENFAEKLSALNKTTKDVPTFMIDNIMELRISAGLRDDTTVVYIPIDHKYTNNRCVFVADGHAGSSVSDFLGRFYQEDLNKAIKLYLECKTKSNFEAYLKEISAEASFFDWLHHARTKEQFASIFNNTNQRLLKSLLISPKKTKQMVKYGLKSYSSSEEVYKFLYKKLEEMEQEVFKNSNSENQKDSKPLYMSLCQRVDKCLKNNKSNKRKFELSQVKVQTKYLYDKLFKRKKESAQEECSTCLKDYKKCAQQFKHKGPALCGIGSLMLNFLGALGFAIGLGLMGIGFATGNLAFVISGVVSMSASVFFVGGGAALSVCSTAQFFKHRNDGRIQHDMQSFAKNAQKAQQKAMKCPAAA